MSEKTLAAPDEMARWSPTRKRLHDVLVAELTEKALGLVIFANLVLLIWETDANADVISIEQSLPHSGVITKHLSDLGPARWITAANSVLIAIYTVEMSTRMYVLRIEFLYDSWCLLDFLIVGSDLVLAIVGLIMGSMPNVGILRAFRLLRLARAFKALSKFPELALLLRGFACALKAIFWGMLLVIIVLTIWSILAVQLLHPINIDVANQGLYDGCHRCPRAFSSVWNSLATFTQQLVAGDSWGTVSLPIIQKRPETYVFFLAVLVSVSLAIMNLILAVIVDSATEARQQALEKSKVLKDQEFMLATERFSMLCTDLDEDGSGYLTLAELIRGYDNNPDFVETMKVMNCEKEDMAVIFSSLDRDFSGTVNYSEFSEEMNKMRSAETHQMVQQIQFYVIDLRKLLLEAAAKSSPAAMKESALESSVVERITGTGSDNKTSVAVAPSSGIDVQLGSWEPLPQPAVQGQGRGANDALAELKRVNQELVLVMKQMVQRTEVHTQILTNVCERLPFQGSWVQHSKEAALVVAPPGDGGFDNLPEPQGRFCPGVPGSPGPVGSAVRSLAGTECCGGYTPEQQTAISAPVLRPLSL